MDLNEKEEKKKGEKAVKKSEKIMNEFQLNTNIEEAF
jgi:hypothetical protein